MENQVEGPELNTARYDAPTGFHRTLTGTGLRTARWKYVRYIDGDAELYDLTRDPNELRNVYGRARYAGVQSRLARVWRTTRDCAGAACRRPLPAALQVGPRQLAEATRTQERGVEARYGVELP